MRSVAILLPFFLSHCFSSTIREETDPTTSTPQGKIVGLKLISSKGRKFAAYRGIPYAKPPIGPLRFKEPQEIEKWSKTFLATKDAPKCAQKNYLFGDQLVEGSEDCLYLNVYVPLLNFSTSKESLLPVMVFIHWGGFFTGYSGKDYLGPEYLMDKDIILVTFNYRLGILGFFSTYDDAAPGNFGLKDQVLALNWIQKNIESFGGDKNRVTLFGQSAGGASVHYHMLSKLSKGLFQRAISESGTALALWAQPSKNIYLPQIQGKIVGCGHATENSSNLVDCLRNVDVETLINSGDLFKFFSIDPLNVYVPSIEKQSKSNSKPFITKHPIDQIKTGNFMKLPWIVGVVSDEGLIRASALWAQATVWNQLNTSFNELMPKMVALGMSVPMNEVLSIWTKIRNFYFKYKKNMGNVEQQTIRGLIDLYTDRSFYYSTYQSTLLHSMRNHNSIWFYKFSYKGKYSYKTLFSGVNESTSSYPHSASHCDDLLYLFKSPSLFPELRNENDQMMIDSMVDLWTNFAINGDPTPADRLDNIPKWSKISNWKRTENGQLNKSIDFLHINGSYENTAPPFFQMDTGIYNERVKFWEELPLSENIQILGQNHKSLKGERT